MLSALSMMADCVFGPHTALQPMNPLQPMSLLQSLFLTRVKSYFDSSPGTSCLTQRDHRSHIMGWRDSRGCI